MWADFKIKTNDENSAVYYYGFESHDLTGLIEYDKKNKQIKSIKLSDNEDEGFFSLFTIHLFYQVVKEGFGDTCAYSLPEAFNGCCTPPEYLDAFADFCNITRMPKIERGLFNEP